LKIIPGLHAPEGIVNLIILILIYLVVTNILKPIIWYLSYAINILTIGLFTLIINVFMLYVALWISDLFNIGFVIDGVLSAMFGAIIISLTMIAVEFSRKFIPWLKPYRKDRDWVKELERSIKWLEEQRDHWYRIDREREKVILEQKETIEKLKIEKN
jgi:putative membrane protein